MHSQKIAQRTVVGFFKFLIEKTGGHLSIFPVIMKAFATFKFFGARLVCAIAVSLVFFHYTFHRITSANDD